MFGRVAGQLVQRHCKRDRGFGSVLLERVVARQFGGELALDFAAGGLRCCVRLPTSRRLLAA